MAITPFEKDIEIIQKLDDEPNDVQGLTPEELKKRFDQAAIWLKEYINGTLIPAITGDGGTGGASNIGAAVDDFPGETVQEVLDAFNDALTDRYTKSETNSYVGQETENLVETVHVDLTTGVIIKAFDLIDTDHSDAFNPFPYLKDDKDAMKLVNNLIKNTTPKNSTNNDPFWEKSEIALDTALILYLLHEAPPEEQNLEMVMYMIENGGAREDDDDFQSPLDMLFEALEEEEPDHVAVREYKIFKQAAGKTAKSILLSAAVRLSAFILPQITRITSRDDMELGLMGERKQAVFAIIPDNDGTFNYLVGMLYTCAFQALYYQADKVHQGALPVPVRLMMDEFCNVSLPDDFGKLQATMRSRNIMSTIVLQNISALKALFKDDWEGLLGNADTLVYLGGNEPSTHKYISELLGKETLDTRNRSVSRGSHGSSSVSYQQTGRELLTPDEVRTLDNDYALLFIRGERPVMDKKYDILKHPYIKLTEDGGASPYVHHPGLTYAQADLSVPFDSLDYIEILE